MRVCYWSLRPHRLSIDKLDELQSRLIFVFELKLAEPELGQHLDQAKAGLS